MVSIRVGRVPMAIAATCGSGAELDQRVVGVVGLLDHDPALYGRRPVGVVFEVESHDRRIAEADAMPRGENQRPRAFDGADEGSGARAVDQRDAVFAIGDPAARIQRLVDRFKVEGWAALRAAGGLGVGFVGRGAARGGAERRRRAGQPDDDATELWCDSLHRPASSSLVQTP